MSTKSLLLNFTFSFSPTFQMFDISKHNNKTTKCYSSTKVVEQQSLQSSLIFQYTIYFFLLLGSNKSNFSTSYLDLNMWMKNDKQYNKHVIFHSYLKFSTQINTKKLHEFGKTNSIVSHLPFTNTHTLYTLA